MAEWWAGSDLILYIDKKDFDKYFGNEHGYLLMNHSYETDWLIGWLLCDRVRLLGVSILLRTQKDSLFTHLFKKNIYFLIFI